MRKFRGFLVLLSLSILLNLTSCLYSGQRKTYAVFADSSREVTLATGTNRMWLGFVLDHREFKIYDYEGNEQISMDFDCDITFLDMMNYYVLFGFSDNHVEVYYMGPDESYILCKHSFEHSIKQAELTDVGKCGIVVLLEDGTLWTSNKDDPKRIKQIAENVNDYAYSVDWNILMYENDQDSLYLCSLTGAKVGFDESLSSLHDVSYINRTTLFSYECESICFVVKAGEETFFIERKQVDQDTNEQIFGLCDVKNGIDADTMNASNSVPESVTYFDKGTLYYEGPSHNRRYNYGLDKGRIKISIPEGYESITILGCVVYYNRNEVNVLVIG